NGSGPVVVADAPDVQLADADLVVPASEPAAPAGDTPAPIAAMATPATPAGQDSALAIATVAEESADVSGPLVDMDPDAVDAAVQASDPGPATEPWRAVPDEALRAPRLFTGLPADDGVVAPIAPHYAPYVEAECLRRRLPEWPPAAVEDPVQRVRNLLFVAAVPDVLRFDEIEATIPLVVLERLRQLYADEDLMRLLYWVGTSPYDGDHSAAFAIDGMCLSIPYVDDIVEVRLRASMYALKFLGRLTGSR
ncbi:MAG TPA: hypothetical protein VNZ57_02090, partial [Longimicrobiales bacterium]|nr:hypothetical protein [Longimicrobiales bacterium]